MSFKPIQRRVTPEQHRANVDAADSVLRQDLARLRQRDGTPRYVPEEMNRREQAAHAKHRETLTAAQEAFAAEAASIQERRDRLDRTESNPINILAGDDLQTANALSGFVQADCERLSLDALTTRVRDTLAAKGSSLAQKVLLARFVALRLEREREAQRGMLSDEAQRLSDALGELKGNLFPKHEGARENLDELAAMLQEAQAGTALASRLHLSANYGRR